MLSWKALPLINDRPCPLPGRDEYTESQCLFWSDVFSVSKILLLFVFPVLFFLIWWFFYHFHISAQRMSVARWLVSGARFLCCTRRPVSRKDLGKRGTWLTGQWLLLHAFFSQSPWQLLNAPVILNSLWWWALSLIAENLLQLCLTLI